MAILSKIDSNVSELAYAVEESLKKLPEKAVWITLEPNSYSDFGGQLTTLVRNPINSSRQNSKGVVTDLEASGGFNTDLTQTNLQDFMQGFMFANLRTKDELPIPAVDGTNNDYEPADDGDEYKAGDLIFAKGFDSPANNGLKVVTGTPAASSVVVTDTNLVTATDQTGIISRVGWQFGDAEVNIDIGSQPLPRLVRVSGTKNFTEFGLIPGEWVFIGGDATTHDFATAANNGFKRVRQVGETFIEFDKSTTTMAAETGTGLSIRIFFGRVLKNELGSRVVRRTYQLERKIGAMDTDNLDQIQSEYLVGAVPNEFTLNVPTAEKITADLSFVALDNEQRSGATKPKDGDRPALVEADAFNTSSDVARIKLATVSSTEENPSALFAFLTELTLVINNNVSTNKAVGVLGAFDATAGQFTVSGSVTAYFADVAAVAAVRNNTDITIDIHLVKANQGISIDYPLLALGDGRLNVEADQPITLPLTLEAARGRKVDPTLDHTILMVFWDYLPNAADV